MKGTWREGALGGDPEGYLEKSMETGFSFRGGSAKGTWRKVRIPGTLRAG